MPRTSSVCLREHPAVGALARGIYGTYARFAIELMRLPALPADEPARLVERQDELHERFMALWRSCQAEGRGLIAVTGHIGSIEVFAGAYAQQGIPTYGLADDSAFPELFELLNASRARWGVTIIPWRRLREIFRVMRRPPPWAWSWTGAIAPTTCRYSCSATGRRCRPVRPRWPPALARSILPVVARRRPDGHYVPVMYEPIEVGRHLRGPRRCRHQVDRRRRWSR